MDNLTWNGHSIIVIRVGIFLTLIEYRFLFTSLSRLPQAGGGSSRQFRVRTIELEMENDVCLLPTILPTSLPTIPQ